MFKGQPIGGLRADQVAHLGIALVPEGRQLFPSLSVEENLLLGGKVGARGIGRWTRSIELFPILEERRDQPRPRFRAGSSRWSPSGAP